MTLHITLKHTPIQGNVACISIRMLIRTACDLRGDHMVSDDLESFFYIIILIMVAFEAPGRYKSDEELEELNLDDVWWRPKPARKHLVASAKWKLSTMKLNKLWKNSIAKNFSDYFACWLDPINQMRKKIFDHYDADDDSSDSEEITKTDGVDYADILQILEVMVKAGTQADEAEAERRSVTDTEIISESDVTPSGDDDIASLLSLEMVDDAPDGLRLTSATAASYTPVERLDIASSLTAVVATSDISEGAALPPATGYMPSRDAIFQRARHAVAPHTLDTGELPSTISEVTPRPAASTIKKRKASIPEGVAAKKSRGETEGGEVGASTREVVTAKKKSSTKGGEASVMTTKRSKGSRGGAPPKKPSNQSRPSSSRWDDQDFKPLRRTR